mgnify:CR=1 FL=1
MSSETGVLDIKPENVVSHGRLEPGKMFLVDMNAGRIINDEEIKNEVVSKRPYRKWLNKNLLGLKEVPYTGNKTPLEKLDFETALGKGQKPPHHVPKIQNLATPLKLIFCR